MIAIEARLDPRASGGVQQAILGLAAGLQGLDDGENCETFIVQGTDHWLRDYAPGVRTHVVRRERREFAKVAGLSAASRIAPGLLRRRREHRAPADWHPRKSDGVAEGLGAGVVHFALQSAYRTALPSLYEPYDLQHEHFPDHFSDWELSYRKQSYAFFAQQASYVIAMTEWGAADIVRYLRVPRDRVVAIPRASVLDLYGARPTANQLELAIRALGLPNDFLLYPAQTWKHKNHLRLLEALWVSRRQGSKAVIVCTGALTAHHLAIVRRREELGLQAAAFFTGYIPGPMLRALYLKARGLVFPSLFEGWGLPLVEAFSAGLPVASSTASALPEVTGSAALSFDPESVESISDAITQIWNDDELRSELAARGAGQAQSYTWRKTVRGYRCLYDRAADTSRV